MPAMRKIPATPIATGSPTGDPPSFPEDGDRVAAAFFAEEVLAAGNLQSRVQFFPEPAPSEVGESHCSPVSTTLSPHRGRRHVERQALGVVSAFFDPQSHSSPGWTMPSPQTER